MHDIEAFLGDVADALPFADAERAEIVEELRAHLDDSTTALQAEGLTVDVARRTALDRLGPPNQLARAMTQARRSRGRMLAAAGAGSWTVVTSGVRGWVVGLGGAALAWLATAVFVRFVGPFAFDSVSLIALGVALFSAGSAVPPVVAARAGYRLDRVRVVMAVIGAVLISTYALVLWSGPLDLVGVVAILTLPIWWILGTLRPARVGWRSIRTVGVLVVVAAIAMTAIQIGQGQLRRTVALDVMGATGIDLGLDRIAAPAPAAISATITGSGSLAASGGSGFAAGTFTIDVADVTQFAGWTDLRVEAWQAIDPAGISPTPVSPQATKPFVVAPASWGPPGELAGGQLTWSSSNPWGPDAQTLFGSVHLDRTPWITAAWVALTGVAPDGVRYRIIEPDYVMAIFNGTPAQWIEAALGVQNGP